MTILLYEYSQKIFSDFNLSVFIPQRLRGRSPHQDLEEMGVLYTIMDTLTTSSFKKIFLNLIIDVTESKANISFDLILKSNKCFNL